MTITTTQSSITYSGNSSTTVFPFPFLIPSADELVVTIVNSGITATVPVSQYNATGFGVPSGGSVTYDPNGIALATGNTLTLSRVLPIVQESSLINQGAMYPKTIETALDYLTMICQDLEQQILNGGNASYLVTAPVLVLNIAALRALTTASVANNAITLAGYFQAADGGGGDFSVNPADATSADNGGTIIVDASLRRWYRQVDRYVSVRMFGALGANDSSGADYYPCQAAINFVATSTNPGLYNDASPWLGLDSVLYWERGAYNFTQPLISPNAVSHLGPGPGSYSGAILTQVTTGQHLFQLAPGTNGGQNSTYFNNLILRAGASASNAGIALIYSPLSLALDSCYITNVWFQTPETLAINIESGGDIRIDGCTFDVLPENGIRLGSATTKVIDSRITNNTFFEMAGYGVGLLNTSGIIISDNSAYGQTGAVSSVFISDNPDGIGLFSTNTLAVNNSISDVQIHYASDFGSFTFSGNTGRNVTNSPVILGGASVLFGVNISGNNYNGFSADFTASASGTVLTVSAVSAGTLAPGMTLPVMTGINADTVIESQISGTLGNIGTYRLNQASTLTSTALSCNWSFVEAVSTGLSGSNINGNTVIGSIGTNGFSANGKFLKLADSRTVSNDFSGNAYLNFGLTSAVANAPLNNWNVPIVTSVITPGSIASGATYTAGPFALQGATVGMTVLCTVTNNSTIPTGVNVQPFVSSSGQITILFQNGTAASVAVGSFQFYLQCVYKGA